VSGTLLVVAGIYVREGRLLLARRPPGGRYPGLWEFPGGKVREDETPEDALVREWIEELDATPAGPVPDGFARDGDVTLLFFRVRGLLGEPRPKGCAAVRWCGAVEAGLLAMPPADAATLHGTLVGATQMAASATRLRATAVVNNDMKLARDASAAAAGALMLGERARQELRVLLDPPDAR